MISSSEDIPRRLRLASTENGVGYSAGIWYVLVFGKCFLTNVMHRRQVEAGVKCRELYFQEEGGMMFGSSSYSVSIFSLLRLFFVGNAPFPSFFPFANPPLLEVDPPAIWNSIEVVTKHT
jgi:hypothetical protein